MWFAVPNTGYTQGNLPTEVLAVQKGHGWMFTDDQGMTLYVYESDEKDSGQSQCNEECVEKWPPLFAKSDKIEPLDSWSLITREDGRHQWAFKGNPVYTYIRDAYVGATFSDGDGWNVALEPIPLPPGIAITETALGHILTSSDGLTLYTNSKNNREKNTITIDSNNVLFKCEAVCLEKWFPITAPWMASQLGDFTVIERDDGLHQWAFKNRPLYRFLEDYAQGDANGDNVDDAWKTVVLEPSPAYPSWVTIVGSDGGDLLADSKGMTLYAYDEDRNHLVWSRGEECFNECIETYWKSVKASSEVPPTGNWALIKNNDGSLQWSYRGQPLYTSKLETRPGDLTGIMLRRARAWRPIMHSMPSIQGASPNG